MRDFNRSGGNSRGGGRSFGGGSRSFGGGGRSDRPEMFDAVCDQCGKDCRVPFRPSGDKPIYCSECFETKRDDGGRDDRGGRFESRERRPSFDRGGFRDREEKQMFTAVCDECGQDCEVPFKPSSNKPIYCSKCFEGKEGNKSNDRVGSNNSELKTQIEALNKKLDKIISILEPVKEVKAVKKAIKKEVAEVVKEVKKTAKKVVKKAKEIKKDITE
jgi:CxxC-x17-CxxC domain-containing protein